MIEKIEKILTLILITLKIAYNKEHFQYKEKLKKNCGRVLFNFQISLPVGLQIVNQKTNLHARN